MADSSTASGLATPTSTEHCILILKAWHKCACIMRRLCSEHVQARSRGSQDQPIEAELMKRLVSDNNQHYEAYSGPYEYRDKCNGCLDLAVRQLMGSQEQPGFRGFVLEYNDREGAQQACSLHVNGCPRCGRQETVATLCEAHPTRHDFDLACEVVSRQDPHNPLRWARKMNQEMVEHVRVVKKTEFCQPCTSLQERGSSTGFRTSFNE